MTMSNTATATAAAASQLNTITSDIARLDALLSKTELTEEEDVDLAELLKRLESAEGMAGEVETRVDDILTKLDGIMKELGDHEEASATEINSDVQPKHN
ncbi:hypothetical protein H0H92_003565 [Tricholoma furcatifolium]|nr:hypothetical protein H0H92_003565 [Tricholoma furcatifolium]